MTYTTAQKDEAAHLFCAQFPHAHYGVVRTWVTCEQGSDNNIFGVTIGGKLQKYPTVEAGVLAAATRIKTLVVYRNLADALNSAHTIPKGCPGFGRHANSQATAFCRSPWNPGLAGLKKQGGLSLYYTRIFRVYGYKITTP